MYSVNELCKLSQLSQASFYRLMKSDPEFSQLIEQHRQRKGAKYLYDRDVLSYLIEHENLIIRERAPETAPEAPESPLEASQNAPAPDSQGDADALKINARKAKIEALEKELEEIRKERNELINQNGQLLLLLAQEKAEKQALLPPPKLTLGERVRRLFKHEGE